MSTCNALQRRSMYCLGAKGPRMSNFLYRRATYMVCWFGERARQVDAGAVIWGFPDQAHEDRRNYPSEN
jgi:hypothetical protein